MLLEWRMRSETSSLISSVRAAPLSFVPRTSAVYVLHQSWRSVPKELRAPVSRRHLRGRLLLQLPLVARTHPTRRPRSVLPSSSNRLSSAWLSAWRPWELSPAPSLARLLLSALSAKRPSELRRFAKPRKKMPGVSVSARLVSQRSKVFPHLPRPNPQASLRLRQRERVL